MKNKIYIKDWQILKPANNSYKTDTYYLKIANKIHSSLGHNLVLLQKFISTEEIKLLCCFIASYFEDVISELNIWSTFRKEHQKLYGRKLPFYKLSNTYIDEEINIEDIRFLLWYFLNTIQRDFVIEPINPFIENLSSNIIKILDFEYEYAPENEKLKMQLSYKNENSELYSDRAFMQRMFLDSYLLYPDIKIDFLIDIEDTVSERIDESPSEIETYFREITESYTYNTRSKLLAFKAKDWASKILGENHRDYDNINNISKRFYGWFLYKSQDQTDVVVEHIASAMQFNITKKSFDHHHNLRHDDLMYLGLVNWNQEWWFTGTFIKQDFDADIILDEKNSARARSQVSFLYDETKVNEIQQEKTNSFLNFNNGSLLSFMAVGELDEFLVKFREYDTKIDLKLTQKEIEEANQRARDEGYFSQPEGFNDLGESDESVVVFFNPKGSFEFYFDVLDAIPDSENPYYVSENRDDIMHLLIHPSHSVEFINYFMENFKDKLSFFKSEQNQWILDDLDFLLRFWKGNSYYTESKIIFTGNNT